MELYICLAIYMLILLFISQIKNRNSAIELFLFFTTLFILWFLTAFRSLEMGNDTSTYAYLFSYYSNIENIDINSRTEIGWQLLCFLVGNITSSVQFFLVFISTLLYSFSGLYIYKYSNNILVSVVILFSFCFSLFFSMLRQSLAMCLVAFAYKQIEKGNNLKGGLLLCLATSFHITAFIAFGIYLRKYTPKSMSKIFICFLVAAGLAFSGILESAVLKFIPWKYYGYFQGMYFNSGYLAVTFMILEELLVLGLLCTIREPKNKLIVSNTFFMLLVSSLGYVMNLFTRLAEYYTFIGYLEIPNLISESRIKQKYLLNISISLIFLISFLTILYFRPNWNHLYPYYFCWEY